MFLAKCICLDEGALICDFAETYHILNYKELPLDLVATLCFGLRDNSRIKMLLSDTNISTDTMLLACMADRLTLLLWMNSEDGKKNRNRPQAITAKLMEKPKESEYMTFRSIDDFERKRQSIING